MTNPEPTTAPAPVFADVVRDATTLAEAEAAALDEMAPQLEMIRRGGPAAVELARMIARYTFQDGVRVGLDAAEAGP